MKTVKRVFAGAVFAAFSLFVSCYEPVTRQSYRVNLPAPPDSWLETLGEAHWLVEWNGADGTERSAQAVPGGTACYAGVMQEWTTPVIAWPHWPDKGIKPGTMMPAGALFPLDVSGGSINLSWSGGADAVFYRELAALAGEKRLPHNFNWARFRKLFSDGDLPESVLQDPWLADWKTIAAKTVSSSFDRRRITARKSPSFSFTVPSDGPWIGTSPFMREQRWQAGAVVTVKARDSVDIYFSPSGILYCSPGASIWRIYPPRSDTFP
ncbi:MAG: hypothetical protein LBH50_02455 [Spirochaetaceae bacterium]|jgi:hypothetical protein|nr:hypothetical protein [Spirochaetaceae bacterium]